MADYRRAARRKARKYGLDPRIFERQINQESGFAPDVITGRRASPAGAQGIAQIMPATARSWGVNPLKPKRALDAAARHMADYVRQFGSYEDALRAYNAGPGNVQASRGFSETNNYVSSILNGQDQKHLNPPKKPGSRRGAGRVDAIQQFTPGVDNTETRKALLLNYLADRGRPDALLTLAAGLKQAQDIPGTSSTKYVKVAGQKGNNRLLVVGDSLAVGTTQFLKNAKTNAQVGRTSTASVRDARKGLSSGRYGRVLLDFGSNDMSARQLVQSVKKAQRLAHGAQVFVPEIKGGPDAAEKTAALKRVKGITVVPWSTPLGPDGVHPADYQARAHEIRSYIGGGSQRRGGKVPGGDILESFYNGPGGANTDEGHAVGRGFVSGHTDHVHVAAKTHKETVELAKVAQNRFGLTVRELEPFDRVDPVHTQGSFHYSGRAADVSGPPDRMAAFSRWLARRVRR